MTPEEAYEITERKWEAIAGGELSIDPSQMANCGLCLFASEMAGNPPAKCHGMFCPVPVVFSAHCWHLGWLQDCIDLHDPEDDILPISYLDLAREVLAQLTSHKDQLIAEMERIRGEK